MNVWKHFLKSTDIPQTAASAKNAKEGVKLESCGGDDFNTMYGNTVYRVTPAQNKGPCILRGRCGEQGQWLEVCQIQKWAAQKATQKVKFNLLSWRSLDLLCHGYLQKKCSKNVKCLVVGFCHFFSLSSQPTRAKDLTAGWIIWPFYTIPPLSCSVLFFLFRLLKNHSSSLQSHLGSVPSFLLSLSCIGSEGLLTGSEFLLSNTVFC
ncbi:hypothetical protein HJG60_008080 [Phyllostomus discolor]|uniref:Uncharacterized protein n=1 Tax=Phyllostomus discolor TaxID=89673 RepID=A0A834BNA7_9CHIR|nr:hypothetical protein HJG60_008080 [Phyllostomus discolor]